MGGCGEHHMGHGMGNGGSYGERGHLYHGKAWAKGQRNDKQSM